MESLQEKRMLTPDERKDLISKIRSLPDQIEKFVRGLSEEQLDTPYRKDGWTVRQVIHHLADSHINGYARFKLTLTEDHPTLKSYDQDEWSYLPDANDLSVGISLSILKGLHDRWAYLLENISSSSWKRVAFHPEDGELTLNDLLKSYAEHCEKHLGHINGLKTAMNW
jgi:DinB superfamily